MNFKDILIQLTIKEANDHELGSTIRKSIDFWPEDIKTIICSYSNDYELGNFIRNTYINQ
jgi:hypothetical protein